jgi:uncharacterized membrane protein required for colicin V production
MTIYDYIFTLILLSFSFCGFFFGIVKSFSKLFCLLVPFFVSFIGATQFNEQLVYNYGFYSGTGSHILSSLILYVGLYLIFKSFFFLIETVLSYVNLSLVNRVLGLIAGLLLGIASGCLFLIVTKKIFDNESFFYDKITGYLFFLFQI